MTTQEQAPAARRRWWQSPRFWIIGLAAVVVVLAAVLIGAFVTNGQQKQADNKPHALLVTMLGQVNDTALAAGGTWTFQDGTGWSPNDTSGYIGQPCGDDDFGPQQYTVAIISRGVDDPAAAAASMAKHWRSLGYAVRYVGTTDSTNNDLTEIAADFPNSGKLVFGVSKVTAGIQGASACSTDPGLSTKTN